MNPQSVIGLSSDQFCFLMVELLVPEVLLATFFFLLFKKKKKKKKRKPGKDLLIISIFFSLFTIYSLVFSP